MKLDVVAAYRRLRYDGSERSLLLHDSELAEQGRRPLLFAISPLHPFVGATRRSTTAAVAPPAPAN